MNDVDVKIFRMATLKMQNYCNRNFEIERKKSGFFMQAFAISDQ